MKKLNIIAANTKLIEIIAYTNPSSYDKLYTLTDGKGNYTLSNDNSIWWADADNKVTLLKDNKIDGSPKDYKGDPLYNVAIVGGKFGIYDLNTLKMVKGPYTNIDQLMQDVYGRGAPSSNILKYLEFDKE